MLLLLKGLDKKNDFLEDASAVAKTKEITASLLASLEVV